MKKVLSYLSILLSIFLFVSCGNKATGQFPGFDKLDGDVYIKFVEENEDGRVVTPNELILVNMVYSHNNDSVLFDSRDANQDIEIPVDTILYPGDINTAFLKLQEGDSAIFILNAQNFFRNTIRARQLPEFIDSTSLLYFNIRVLKVQTREERRASREEEKQRLIAEETEQRNKYLEENNITTEPRPSGLIYISKEEGTGKQAKRGKTVRVKYAGKLLDGRYFDTSIEEVAKEQGIFDPNRTYEPLKFPLGKGRVIKGWDSGISLMKEGGKAQLIIPSDIAYGNQPPPGIITPYSTLVFDVELVEVLD